MPKCKESSREKVKRWLRELPNDDVFQQHSSKEHDIFCKACGKIFTCKKKNHIEQHAAAPGHKANVAKPQRHRLLADVLNETEQDKFNNELCDAFLSANIPFHKLNNPKLSAFLEKHCHRKLASESTIRKSYMPKCYDKTIDNIRKGIGNNYIWVSVDETTDAKGRFMANIIVGKLSSDDAGVPYLLASKPLERTNNETMARFINDSLGILWPCGVQYDKVKLFVTDGASYMVKCGTNLKVFYKNVIHLTCFAHGLNLVCECIRNQYDIVNVLISNVKKIFLKAPLRVQFYQQTLPDVPLPPEPILTRWGTWIEAAVFYAEHFEEVKNVVMGFDKHCSKATEKAQECFAYKNLKNELCYIKAHFKMLTENINKLETFGLPLTESYKIIDTVEKALKIAPGPVGQLAYEKFQSIMLKNPGFNKIQDFARLLNGEKTVIDYNNVDWSVYKFCPTTSCDVERSFSSYKIILTDRRMSFTTDNLEKHIVCYVNSKFEKT